MIYCVPRHRARGPWRMPCGFSRISSHKASACLLLPATKRASIWRGAILRQTNICRSGGSYSRGRHCAFAPYQFHKLDLLPATLSRIPQCVLDVPDAVEPHVAVNVTVPEHVDD